MRPIAWATSAIGFSLFAACVGDDPATIVTADDGGAGADAGPGRESGVAADDAAIDAREAGRVAKGEFVWALTAPRGPGALTDGRVAIGGADKVGGATGVSASTAFGGKATTGPGAALFRADASKNVAFATLIPSPAGGEVAIGGTATDSAGDIYVVGSFTANNLTIGTTSLVITGTGASDFFAKFSGSNGSLLWARSLKPSGYAVARAVTTRGTDVALAFEFGGNGGSGTVTYDRKDGGTTTPVTVTAEGGSPDGLVLFLDGASGKALWAKHVHGPSTDRLESIRIDASGSVFVGGGSFSSTMKVDASPSGILVKAGDATSASPFVLRFDSADPHPVGFARSFGLSVPSKSGTVSGLAVAANGDVLVCGSFEGGIDLGLGVQSGKGLTDGFVARLPATGSVPSWARVFGGAQPDECTSVDADPTDQVVVGLSYQSSGVVLDGHTFGDPLAGQPAGAVAKLSGAGAFQWGFDVTGQGASIRSVAIHPSGDVLYSGSFIGGVNLGDGNVQSGNNGTEPSYFLVRRAY